MTRTPLRPLARILEARQNGQNPDVIERENLRQRHEMMREKGRGQAQFRMGVLGLAFISGFVLIGLRIGALAATEPVEPRSTGMATSIAAGRADITDRNGNILATNLSTFAVYVQTKDLIDPTRVSTELARIFPELNADDLLRRLTDGRNFLWIRKVLSPEQKQAVQDIGDPGVMFGPREMRLYPNGNLAAHILGGATFGAEGVNSAELIGMAGIEKAMDARLRDPAQAGAPLVLSLDLTVQAAVEEVLATGITMMTAKGGAAILMDVKTGEVVALAAGPSFDPNDRPANPTQGDPSDSPLFNRAVQGIYELGSTFKIFAAAQAMELGLVHPDTQIDTRLPFKISGHSITEFDEHNYGPSLSLSDVIAKSSNVGAAHLGLMIGGERQKQFLKSLGLLDPSPIELIEAAGAKPLVPERWPELTTVNVSFGYALSGSPLNLASAYATIANGGHLVTPTLLHGQNVALGPAVISPATATESLNMMRRVVTEGTASLGDVPGYDVGGKTGTANKVTKAGVYTKERVVNTFACIFPIHNPKYVLVVTLDEPSEKSGPSAKRTAGWTAVPVAAEIIRRAAPLLGLRPMVDPGATDGVTAVQQ